jgi:hypothetical protein
MRSGLTDNLFDFVPVSEVSNFVEAWNRFNKENGLNHVSNVHYLVVDRRHKVRFCNK